jgi:hypothetical protein
MSRASTADVGYIEGSRVRVTSAAVNNFPLGHRGAQQAFVEFGKLRDLHLALCPRLYLDRLISGPAGTSGLIFALVASFE